jgi:hypothetical protein
LENQNPKCVNCGEGHPANYRGCIVAKKLQKIKNKKGMKGKPVKNIVPKDTIIQQNERANSLTKGTYASVAASGMNHQRTQSLEYNDINQTIQLILTKFTNLDGALSKMNERVKELESNNKKTAPNSKNKMANTLKIMSWNANGLLNH